MRATAAALVIAALVAPVANGAAPRLVGEGVVSTPADEFGGQPDENGAALFFNRSVPRSQLYTIFVARLRGGRWNDPEVAPFSGRWRDFDAVLSPDGARLFFVSDRPNGAVRNAYAVWSTTRNAGGWSEPLALPAAINAGDVHFASATRDGTLYFTASRQTNLGLIDVYRSRLVDGRYAEAENVGEPINGPGLWNLEAFVAPDESFMILSSVGHPDALGDSDLYVSYRDGERWSAPANLGPEVNSAARDYSPRVAKGRLIFASERGLPTEPRVRPFTYAELTRRIRGVANGLGNVYEIDLADALPPRGAR